jgi:hypothetical protein
MKKTLHTCLLLLFLLALKTTVVAQVKIDETNLLTRLSGLNMLSAAEAEKYFTDHGYTLFSKKTVSQPTYSMELYKFKLSGETSSYLLTVIGGEVCGSGQITYNEDDYQQALKIIAAIGFVAGEATTPGSGKTLFAKGDLRFLVQKQTVDGKSFYVMMLNDLLKIAKQAGFKK